MDDVTIQEDHEQEVVHLLTHLNPYTQYAFYVKTYTIAKENNGAQSNITYFTTSPSGNQNLSLYFRTIVLKTQTTSFQYLPNLQN